MTVISKNYHGKVYSTSNKGFSVKREAARLEKLLFNRGFDVEMIYAKTGTVYLECEKQSQKQSEYINFKIRVSNHTKRSHYNEIEVFEGIENMPDEINIFNTDSFYSVCDYIENVDKLWKSAYFKTELEARKKAFAAKCEIIAPSSRPNYNEYIRFENLQKKHGRLFFKANQSTIVDVISLFYSIFKKNDLSDKRYLQMISKFNEYCKSNSDKLVYKGWKAEIETNYIF